MKKMRSKSPELPLYSPGKRRIKKDRNPLLIWAFIILMAVGVFVGAGKTYGYMVLSFMNAVDG